MSINLNEYFGVIHCHSVFSDGTGYPDEIANAGNEVGLDFVVLTDHNTLRAKKEGFEKYYGKTLLIVGCEVNDKENINHYLTLGVNDTLSTRLSALEYTNIIKNKGGIGFIAHPHESRNNFEQYPPYPWTAWETDAYTGIEIWNHMSEWLENLNEQNKYQCVLHPRRTLTKPKDITLEKWDSENLKRPVVGIAGVDAHAHKANVLGLFNVEIFPYKVMFLSLRTHILTSSVILSDNNNIDLNKSIITDALKNGQVFFANDHLANSCGYRFYCSNKDKVSHSLTTVEYNDSLTLTSIAPSSKCSQKLIFNSKAIFETDKSSFDFCPKYKGVYRVEVLIDKKNWIYSNPIRII